MVVGTLILSISCYQRNRPYVTVSIVVMSGLVAVSIIVMAGDVIVVAAGRLVAVTIIVEADEVVGGVYPPHAVNLAL